MGKIAYSHLLAIPNLLRRRRKRMKLSQRDLAEDSKISKRVIENAENAAYYESGKSINLISFLRILQALRIKVRFVDADTNRDLNGRFMRKTKGEAEEQLDQEDRPEPPLKIWERE